MFESKLNIVETNAIIEAAYQSKRVSHSSNVAESLEAANHIEIIIFLSSSLIMYPEQTLTMINATVR